MQTDREFYRSLLECEHNNLNSHVGWLICSQGVFLAVFALLLEQSAPLSLLVCFIALVSCGSLKLYLHFNLLAIERIETEWEQLCTNDPQGHFDITSLGTGETSALIKFMLPWNVLPVLFACCWAYLAGHILVLGL